MVRPPVSHVVIGVIFFLAFELVGWGLIYVNFNYPSSDWQPRWEETGPMRPWSEHSSGDQLATIAFLTFFCGAFIAGGCFALWMGSWHFRPWQLWREGSVLRVSRGRKSWSFDSTARVRLAETRMLGSRGLALTLESGPPDGAATSSLRLHRMVENKGVDLTRVREEMDVLAERVAGFLGCQMVDQTLATGGQI